ncbi:BN159_2729 family protein [Streptomyces sp. NBC_00637]|uniref:BN159_2729 family protein n=1 Tax=Streptomyces sp. NBC_00637 TaxID=2903667 RepID=UPI0032444D5A
MNGNVPHAARVIRTVLGAVRTEQAAAVAHALDSARLLVDPERSFGVVLYRTPDGGWARTARPVTALERQALDWDTSCERARHVARAVERHLDTHPGPHAVRVEGDRVRVLLRVDGPAQWARWRSYFGIALVGERTDDHTLTGEGEREGVRVTVVALSASVAPPEPTTGEGQHRFRLGETLYDLALPLRDGYGGIWYFEGRRSGDGMPLMALDGRPERCSLANVAAYLGPLSPVRPDEDGTAVDPAGHPSALPTPPALPHPTPPTPYGRAVPHTLPGGPGPWAAVDVSETAARPDVPRPRVMSDLPDPRTLAGPPYPWGMRTVSDRPDQARTPTPAQGPAEEQPPQPQAQEPGSGAPSGAPEPVEPPHREAWAAWAEPCGPLVPSVAAAGPAGPVR